MRPEFVGALLALALLGSLAIPICVRAFGRDRHAERWGRYEYTVTRSGSFIDSGSSFRLEDPAELDEIARRILTEWFESLDGQDALCEDPHHGDYRCLILLHGYGAGEAWGR